MKVFYLGANIHQEALEIIDKSNETMLVYEEADVTSVTQSIGSLETMDRAFCLSRKRILSTKSLALLDKDGEYGRIAASVLNDFRLPLLRTRWSRLDLRGAYYGFCYFADVVDYALYFFEKYKPELIYCSYTPHTLEAWIFMRALEEVGVRIIRLIISPLPWVLIPIVGLSNERIRNLASNQGIQGTEKIQKYMSLLADTYDKAVPYYEKTGESLKSNIFSLINIVRHPKEILKHLEKLLVLNEYKKSTSPVKTNIRFAVYFLHYQPEMNTLPEADIYCDQYQAIKKISWALPEGVKLFVKEHPSTFTKRCDRRWRPQGFYDRITKLPNTHICSPDLSAFDLIDRSLFVASIAGISLTEALIRGIPVVAFYTPRYRHFSDDLVIDASSLSVPELRSSIERMISSQESLPRQKLVSCLEEVALNGYDGSDDVSFIPTVAEQRMMSSKRANCLAIKEIMEGTLR
ncbi:MAG TPA: hypothetical protein ENI73_01835 [Spirochaetes bacterium]|nr:hypothetical protein [Spirochaetota bacterium]